MIFLCIDLSCIFRYPEPLKSCSRPSGSLISYFSSFLKKFETSFILTSIWVSFWEPFCIEFQYFFGIEFCMPFWMSFFRFLVQNATQRSPFVVAFRTLDRLFSDLAFGPSAGAPPEWIGCHFWWPERRFCFDFDASRSTLHRNTSQYRYLT